MTYVYFTKTLQALDLPGLIAFAKGAGLQGLDLAVRRGYPLNPENALRELPKAAKTLKDEGLIIGLVSASTDLIDPNGTTSRVLFESCALAGVPFIKVGYFPYQAPFAAALREARRRLADFAKLAEKTGVRACYHTHSGSLIGNNAAGLRMLLSDFDPHHVGAYIDTGHLAVNGGPIRMEMDLARPWLALVAIKDMLWKKGGKGWHNDVVPAGTGIVRWQDAAQGLKDCGFSGTISLHGEYEAKDFDERKRLAKEELAFLKAQFG